MEIPNIYEGNYKLLIALPLALIVLSLFFIPKMLDNKGVDFRGGVFVTLRTNESIDTNMLKEKLIEAGFKEPTVTSKDMAGGSKSIEIEIAQDDRLARAEVLKVDFFDKLDQASLLESELLTNRSTQAEYNKARTERNAIADETFQIAGSNQRADTFTNLNVLRKSVSESYVKINSDYQAKISATIDKYVKYDNLSSDVVSANLSQKFISTAVWIVIASGILTSIVVFALFRSFVPSVAVLIGAVADITIAMGAMGLFGVKFTLASFAALLMLIGFSLDTDILLTMRVMKRKEGTPMQRAFEAMKTGTTMSIAALVAFVTLFILALFTQIPTYTEISSVAIAGLVGDMFATWCLNAVIILWFVEKKEGVSHTHHSHPHGTHVAAAPAPKTSNLTSIFNKRD